MRTDGDIGRQIMGLRKAKGWSQSQLAEVSGLHLRTVQRAEAGKSSPETLLCLASALDVDIRDLHLAGLPSIGRAEGTPRSDLLAQRPSILARITSGKALLDLVSRGVSWQFDHDVLTGQDAEIVADLFQAVQGYGCLYPELQPGERVRASASLHERVKAIEERGLVLMGAVVDRPLLIRPGHPIQRPVSLIVVQRPQMASPEKAKPRKKE